MRLATDEQQQILQIVQRHVGESGRVRVYGSRLHDGRRGGDIDLMIESACRLTPLEKAALQLELEQALQLPVDILHHQTGTPLTVFQSMARAGSRPLREHRS